MLQCPDREEKAFKVANGACDKRASGDGVMLVDVAAAVKVVRDAYEGRQGSTRAPVGSVDALEILENVSTARRLMQSEAMSVGTKNVLPLNQ